MSDLLSYLSSLTRPQAACTCTFSFSSSPSLLSFTAKQLRRIVGAHRLHFNNSPSPFCPLQSAIRPCQATYDSGRLPGASVLPPPALLAPYYLHLGFSAGFHTLSFSRHFFWTPDAGLPWPYSLPFCLFLLFSCLNIECPDSWSSACISIYTPLLGVTKLKCCLCSDNFQMSLLRSGLGILSP